MNGQHSLPQADVAVRADVSRPTENAQPDQQNLSFALTVAHGLQSMFLVANLILTGTKIHWRMRFQGDRRMQFSYSSCSYVSHGIHFKC